MAYVVARPKGRFEIRESVHTPKGPRARSLANFEQLTDEVLDPRRRRASRPFDAEVPYEPPPYAPPPGRLHATGRRRARHAERPETRRFVESSRRMARARAGPPSRPRRQDPGDALIDLLGFVAQITPFTAPRPARAAAVPTAGPPAGRRAARAGGPVSQDR